MTRWSVLLVCLFIVSCTRREAPVFRMVGAMHDVVMKGNYSSKVLPDTIRPKEGLIGLGPAANLEGEITAVDGEIYHSVLSSDGQVQVTQPTSVGAAFFGYTNVADWSQSSLPDSVRSLNHLQFYLDAIGVRDGTFFKVKGTAISASGHVLNLPDSVKGVNPIETHNLAKHRFGLNNAEVVIVGFFSRKHKTIFTKHDSFLHTHFFNADRTLMGHLEQVELDDDAKLLLPAN